MIEFVRRYGFNRYSQNGEDGIIKECLNRIKIPEEKRHSVEIGAPTFEYCSNTARLFDQGWTRCLIDVDPKEEGINKLEVTADNINTIPPCEVLSIDIDGNDYAVWKAYKGKPAIVIIEINSSLDPSVEFFHPERGASYITMLRLGIEKGYFLLCHIGNMVFVANEYRQLFPEIGDPYDYEKFFDKRWLLQPA